MSTPIEVRSSSPGISSDICFTLGLGTPRSQATEESSRETSACHTNFSPPLPSHTVNLHPLGNLEGRESLLEGSLNSSLDSLDSFHLGNHTPEIVDDITTPCSSLRDLDSEDEVSLGNSFSEEIFDNDRSLERTLDILVNAGYSPSTIKVAVKSDVEYKHRNENPYGRSRPRTQVFYQGKVFTYEKLEVPTDNLSNKSRVISSSLKPMLLNPEATPFVPIVVDKSKFSEEFVAILEKDALSSLKDIRISNLKNVIIGQLNINSLRNKFQFLGELVHGNIDILILTETKLDHTFPEKQFLIPGYKKAISTG